MTKPVTSIHRDQSACLYTEYFKLSEPPFSLTPDPRYLFMSERHREGLAHLFYGVQQPGGFVQLTGEIGSGKTTLSRCLVRQLPPHTDVALILNPRLTAIELLATVCDELRIPYPVETQSIKILIDALNQHLLEAHDQHRRTVLIIDEAQNLSGDVLEQIRLLTNLETSQEKLLQIILIGQPELLTVLKGKDLKQIAQRVTARYHLLALSRHETFAYIRHRLRVAGRKDPIFTDSAMRCIYRLSCGMPRLINILCDRSLLGAYALDKRQVNAAIVRRASRETQGTISLPRSYRFVLRFGVVAILALIAAGAVLFNSTNLRFWRQDKAASSSIRNDESQVRTAAPPVSMQRMERSSSKIAEPVQTGASSTPGPTSSPKPQGNAEKGPASAADLRLADLFSNPSRSAFTFSDLFTRYGIQPSSKPSELGCKTAQAQGFECQFLVGNWHKLRRYDVPAILELLLPTGVHKRATLVGLNGDIATLVVGGHEYSFPLSEVDQVWDGSFIILWKPPYPPPYPLAPGAAGDNVVWVRRALEALDKRPADSTISNVYDDELRQRIRSFQHNRSLIQDGLLGHETLVRLTLALEGPNAPSLSKATR
jgi:general secretion pathway protein A